MSREYLTRVLQRGWSTRPLNYRLLAFAGLLMLTGSILMWARVGTVVSVGSGHESALSAANYEICNFLFVWLCGCVVLVMRDIRCGFHTRCHTLLMAGFLVYGA